MGPCQFNRNLDANPELHHFLLVYTPKKKEMIAASQIWDAEFFKMVPSFTWFLFLVWEPNNLVFLRSTSWRFDGVTSQIIWFFKPWLEVAFFPSPGQNLHPTRVFVGTRGPYPPEMKKNLQPFPGQNPATFGGTTGCSSTMSNGKK